MDGRLPVKGCVSSSVVDDEEPPLTPTKSPGTTAPAPTLSALLIVLLLLLDSPTPPPAKTDKTGASPLVNNLGLNKRTRTRRISVHRAVRRMDSSNGVRAISMYIGGTEVVLVYVGSCCNPHLLA